MELIIKAKHGIQGISVSRMHVCTCPIHSRITILNIRDHTCMHGNHTASSVPDGRTKARHPGGPSRSSIAAWSPDGVTQRLSASSVVMAALMGASMMDDEINGVTQMD